MKKISTLFLFLLIYTCYSQEIEVITQEKTQGIVTILSYSPNGKLIASGSAKENSIKVWDLTSGKIIGKLEGHEGATTALNFTKDGKHLISSAKDDYLIIWDITKWKIADSIKIKSPINWMVNDVQNQDIFYTTTEGGVVYKWNINKLNERDELYKEAFPIVKIDACRTHIATGNSAGRVTIYNLNNKAIEHSKKAHVSAVRGLKFHNKGLGLISTGGGGLVHFWNVNDLENSKKIKAANNLITAFDANENLNRFVVATSNRKIKVFDFEGQEIFEFKDRLEDHQNTEKIRALKISPDGSTVASSGFNKTKSFKLGKSDNIIRIWDMNRGTLFKVLEGHLNPIYTFDFHPIKNEIITLGDENTLTFWDFNLGEKYGDFSLQEPKREVPPKMKFWKKENVKKNASKLLNKISDGKYGDPDPIIKENIGKDIGSGVVKRKFKEKPLIKFSSQGNYLLTKLPKDEIRYYNLKNRVPEYIGPLWSYQTNINQILCSPNEKYLAVLGSGDSAVSIINMETGEFIRKLDTPAPENELKYITEAKSMAYSPDGKMLAICFNTSKTFVFGVDRWNLLFENELPGNMGISKSAFVNFTEDGKQMVINSMFGIKKYNTKTFNLESESNLAIQGKSKELDKPSNYTITHLDDYIYIENIHTGAYNKVLRSTTSKDITHVSVSPAGKFGITTKSGQFLIVNPENAEHEILLVADKDNFIFKTSDNFYKVSKDGYALVTFRIGNKAYPFEQFDAIFNRPDLVLKKLGCKDEDLLKLYKMAYKKRIKKLGLEETTTVSLSDIPTLDIKNSKEIPAITENESIDAQFEMNDKTALLSYNIYINNVPIYGKKGKLIEGKKSLSINETITLIHGINKIQIACKNKAGYESLMQTFYVEKTAEKIKRDLYLITIGISQYKDDRYNLTYPVKDAEDLVTLMSNNNEEVYKNIHSKSLHNEDVTIQNITALREFLSESKPDDIVMIFVAGHGVLDDQFDYYFGTYDMDFSNPSDKGLPYEQLEGILDGIKANKKILIMDTCHSGEIDKEDVFFASTTDEDQNNDEDLSFRAVGPSVEENSNATPSRVSVQLFNDLRRGTGSTVISSAGGTEFAMESDEWKNGLFTYALLLGLKSGNADLDKNGEIMLLELQEYVVDLVTKLSKGKQLPNTRIKNMELDFRIW